MEFFFWAWTPNPSEGGKCDIGNSPHDKPAETVCQQNWPASTSITRRSLPLISSKEMLVTAAPVQAYDCSTGNGWDSWSWGGNVTMKSTDFIAPGCSYSIHAQLDEWGCVSLHPTNPLDVSGYLSLNITISVNQTSVSTIWLFVTDQNGKDLPQTNLDKYTDTCALPVKSFVTLTLPLSDILFGTTIISSINFKNQVDTAGEWWHGTIVFF